LIDLKLISNMIVMCCWWNFKSIKCSYSENDDVLWRL